MDVGHVIGLTPHFKFKEVYYTRDSRSQSAASRNVWAAMDATKIESPVHRRRRRQLPPYQIEPSVMYEYVPGSDQTKIAQIDQIDDIPKKNLLTYPSGPSCWSRR